MKIRIANSNVSLFLRVLRHTLLATGLLILVYCAIVFLDTWAFQKQESREFDNLLAQQRELAPDPAQPEVPALPNPDELIVTLVEKLRARANAELGIIGPQLRVGLQHWCRNSASPFDGDGHLFWRLLESARRR